MIGPDERIAGPWVAMPSGKWWSREWLCSDPALQGQDAADIFLDDDEELYIASPPECDGESAHDTLEEAKASVDAAVLADGWILR